MSETLVDVVEYTDPLCSIAWGTEPYKRLLQWRFAEKLNWRPVMAGLCHDNSKAKMFLPWDSYKAGQIYLKIWQRVTGITGMPYPEDLRYMAVTTDPPCLLVKAAELQGEHLAEAVLRRFREAVFFYGTPVDNVDQAAAALADVPGLDIEQLLQDAETEAVQAAYLADWQETREPNDYVRELAKAKVDHLLGGMMYSEGHERYNLPTFIFKGPAGEKTVPGYRPYKEYEAALEAVAPGITANPRPLPTLAEAMQHWPTLTAKEAELICSDTTASADSIEGSCVEAGGSSVWLNQTESRYWQDRKGAARS